jgi:hypothetical protein
VCLLACFSLDKTKAHNSCSISAPFLLEAISSFLMWCSIKLTSLFGWRISLPCHHLFVGWRISLPRRLLFDQPAHPIAAPPSLQSAGASHCRAVILISASASHCCAAISILAGALSRRPIKFLADASLIAAPQSIISAGASNCHATILYFSQRIQSLRHNPLFQPAHPIAAPQSIISAGASNRRANPSIFGRHIQSPRHNPLLQPAHPIVVPTYLFWPMHPHDAPPYRIFGRRIPSPIAPFNIPAGAFDRPSPPLIFRLAHSITHRPL